MMTSASTRCLSNSESSPSLLDVVTSSWPCSSIHFRIPSSFSVVPRSCGSCSAWMPPWCCQTSFRYHPRRGVTYVVEDKKNLSLL